MPTSVVRRRRAGEWERAARAIREKLLVGKITYAQEIKTLTGGSIMAENCSAVMCACVLLCTGVEIALYRYKN